MFLRGSNIRFVHIPDNVDIMQLVEDRVSVDPDTRAGVLCAQSSVQYVMKTLFLALIFER